MARPRRHVPPNVFENSRCVGRLNRQSSGAIDFHYDPSWLTWEHALPVSLSLPLRAGPLLGWLDDRDNRIATSLTAICVSLTPTSSEPSSLNGEKRCIGKLAQPLVDEARVNCDRTRRGQQLEEGLVGGQTEDRGVVEGPAKLFERIAASLRKCDQLGQHRVVMRRDDLAASDSCLDTDVVIRKLDVEQHAGRRHELSLASSAQSRASMA